MAMLVYTGSKRFIGEIHNKGLSEGAAKEELTMEVYTKDNKPIATMVYERLTKDEFLSEIQWTGCNVENIIKVTDLKLCNETRYIEEFLSSLYETFIEALNFVHWGVIYIQLDASTFNTISSLENKLIDCSHKFMLNNSKINSLLLYL